MTPREQTTWILERLGKIGDPSVSPAVYLQQVDAALEEAVQARDHAFSLRQTGDGRLPLWPTGAAKPLGWPEAYDRPDERLEGRGVARMPGRVAAANQAGDMCLGVVEVPRSSAGESSQDDAQDRTLAAAAWGLLIQDTR